MMVICIFGGAGIFLAYGILEFSSLRAKRSNL